MDDVRETFLDFLSLPRSFLEHDCYSIISNKPRCTIKKVQVGKDQEKAQSEKGFHSKNRGGKKKQTNNQALIP